MGSGATVGADQYPAKFSFDPTTASCTTDFVVFNTGVTGSATQASVIAYSNLYDGCGGTVPSTAWAYDTGGTASTSVALSGDGAQIAFVQAQAGVATLVILKWQASTTETAGAPMVLSSTSNALYRTCAAPCMTTLTFSNNSTDTLSAPFYDFSPGSDVIYVGDDVGHLHKFTGVFFGTPAEATSPWPVAAGVVRLSSPVYDSGTGNVFMTSSFNHTTGNGARLLAVCATSACTGVSNGAGTVSIGSRTFSNILGPSPSSSQACHGTGASGNGSDLVLPPPILDSTAGKLYVFLGNDGNGNSSVIQFATTVSTAEFSENSCGTEAIVGTASTTGIPLFPGNFDNLYLTSATGTSPSGNIYVCGNTSGDATLYQVPINSNVMTSPGTSVLAVSTGSTPCSPVTEADNGTTDLIFLSVQSLSSTSSPVNCLGSGGCLMAFSIPKTLGGALPTSTTATLDESGGTSGIIIDNFVTPGTLHTSQVYFSTLTAGTAVQASQAGLQ